MMLGASSRPTFRIEELTLGWGKPRIFWLEANRKPLNRGLARDSRRVELFPISL